MVDKRKIYNKNYRKAYRDLKLREKISGITVQQTNNKIKNFSRDEKLKFSSFYNTYQSH
jgi:hypothetical protein